jgi:hypothetical protein
MHIPLKRACFGGLFGILVTAAVLAGTAAHAFTMENQDASGNMYAPPKFDLEEQMRQFRNDGAAAPSNGKREFDTPFGKGTFELGMQQRPWSNFGSPFGPSFGSSFESRTTRQDFDRKLAPPGLQHQYDRR